ncbi:MAG: AMP-binding protein [Mariprofundaceae bacterium]|nr:AMP-binding protein [Mariprofundaceae bacterium]
MRFFVWIIRTCFKLAYRLKIEGMDNLDSAGERVLIVANHTSLLDGVLLGLFLGDDISFAIHNTFMKTWWMPLIKPFIKLFPMNNNDPMAMKSLITHLKENNRVMIFPEGRITATGSLMKIYAGPGMAADKAGAKIVPVRIDGAQYTRFSYLKGQARLRWFPQIRLTVLPARGLNIPEGLTPRQRREKAGNILADIMSEMIFESTPYRCRIWDALLEAARTHGFKHLIVEDVERNPLSYRQLFTRSFLLADLMAPFLKDDKQGAHIGLLLPNVSAVIVSFFALHSRGYVPTMLNYTMGPSSLLSAIRTAEVSTVITSHKFVEAGDLHERVAALEKYATVIYLEDIKPRATLGRKLKALACAYMPRLTLHRHINSVGSQDYAVILFTSGSEGSPKGVALSHKNVLANVAQMAARANFTPADVCLNALPLFHSFGLTAGAMNSLLNGMRMFLYPSPLHYKVIPEEAYDLNATVLFGTNVFLAGYGKHAHPYDFYSLRYVVAGAEKLQDETRELWMEKFGIRIFEGYGATETSPVLSVNTPLYYKKGSVGRLLPSIQSRLVGVQGIRGAGRLLVKGPNIMAGYLLSSRLGRLTPPERGWYDTGDIVRIDDEGFLFIQGRVKRFAKIAGEMVSLAASEELVSDCWPEEAHAIVSISDAKKGEQLILLTMYPDPNRKELQDKAKEKGMSEIQVPRILYHVDAIPLMGTGKVNYPEVHAMVLRIMRVADSDAAQAKIVTHDNILTKTGTHAAHGR